MNDFLEKVCQKKRETGSIHRRKNTHETDKGEHAAWLEESNYFLPETHAAILEYFTQIQPEKLFDPTGPLEYREKPDMKNRRLYSVVTGFFKAVDHKIIISVLFFYHPL